MPELGERRTGDTQDARVDEDPEKGRLLVTSFLYIRRNKAIPSREKKKESGNGGGSRLGAHAGAVPEGQEGV